MEIMSISKQSGVMSQIDYMLKDMTDGKLKEERNYSLRPFTDYDASYLLAKDRIDKIRGLMSQRINDSKMLDQLEQLLQSPSVGR